MELRGENVVLRPLTIDDIEAVAEIRSEPGVARWWATPRSPSSAIWPKAAGDWHDGLLMDLLADEL